MGTPIKYQQYHQILTYSSESNGKKRLDFLKFAGLAGLVGRSVEWNFWI
jgi:hypothetical protein